MLIRHLVTAIIATLSLIFSYQATKTITRYIFDEVFDTATNFDKCSFDYSNFEEQFDPFEELLSAFESAPIFEPVDTSNAEINNSESASTFSDFCFSSFSTFSDYPADSPSSTTDSPSPSPSPSPASASTDLVPTKSAPSVTGHSDSSYCIGFVFIILITRSFWFKRKTPSPPPPDPPPLPPDPPPARPRSPSPPPPPLPPLPPSPLPPSPPPQRPPSPPPSPVSPLTLPSAAPTPASAVKERLALVAAPARQVAGARRKSRRAKKRS